MSRLASCLVLTASALILGCGPSMQEVTGTVTSAGKPVPNVQVVYLGSTGETGLGKTDGSGKYAVSVPPGKYQVSVTLPPGEATIPDSSDPYAIQNKFPFPAKYAAPGTSGLTYEVTGAGTNDLKLD
jgi:hypothetical protein